MKPNQYVSEVFERWCYVAEHYLYESCLPLTVLLTNCTQKRGPVEIKNILVDRQTQTVKVITTANEVIAIDQAHQWLIANGKTKSGKTIWTSHL